MSRLFIITIAIFGTQNLAVRSARAEEPFRPTISVTGTSEIRVVPDEVVLTLSIESRKEEVEKAFEDNDEKIRSVMSMLKNSGIESKDIRTEIIQVSPIFSQPGKHSQKIQQNVPPNENAFSVAGDDESSQLIVQSPVGYLAKRQLALRIKQLDEFEEIYRKLIKSGVNSIEGISFQTSKLREYRDEARLKAVHEAREKAEAMAEALQARIAAVDTVSEQSGRYLSGSQSVFTREDPFGGENTDEIAAGMLNITSSVEVVFLLDDVAFEH